MDVPLKTALPSVVRDEGRTTEERFVFSKALLSMLVIPPGKLMEARDEQPEKAYVPIEVRLSGKVMEARDVHPSKALDPIEVRLDGRSTSVRLPAFSNKDEGRAVIPSSTVADVKESMP